MSLVVAPDEDTREESINGKDFCRKQVQVVLMAWYRKPRGV